jgi:hypothetical protein
VECPKQRARSGTPSHVAAIQAKDEIAEVLALQWFLKKFATPTLKNAQLKRKANPRSGKPQSPLEDFLRRVLVWPDPHSDTGWIIIDFSLL